MVPAEGLIQLRVDDAFVVLDLRDHGAVGRIDVVDIGAGERAVVAGDANLDANRPGGERATVLAVAAGETGERPGPVLVVAPEDHHLEAGIEYERVGNPRIPERFDEPFPGGRGRVDVREERPFSDPFDPFDPVQDRPVEEKMAVDFFVRMRVRLKFRHAVRSRGRWQFGRQQDFGARMEEIAAVAAATAQLHGDHEALVVLHAAAGQGPDRSGRALVHEDAVGHPHRVETVEQQTGVAVQRRVGQPFHVQRHRDDGATIDHVRPQHRVAVQIDDSFEDDFEIAHGQSQRRRRGRGGRGRTGSDRRHPARGQGIFRRSALAQGHDFRGAPGEVQLLECEHAAFVERDHPDAFALEHFAQARRHHAAVPRPPVDGDHAGVRPAPRFHLRHLVQHLVGDGVGRLAGAAEAGGGAAEQDQQLQLLTPEVVEQVPQAVDLGGVDAVELVGGQLFDPLVGQHPRPVDDARDVAVLHLHLVEQVGHPARVGHIGDVVHHLGPGPLHAGQVRSDLPLRQNPPIGLGHTLRGRGRAELLGDGFFQRRFVLARRDPFRLRAGGQRCPPGQNERRPERLGERRGDFGGHPAAAAGNHDDILRPEREGAGRRFANRAGQFHRAAVRFVDPHFNRPDGK